MTWLQLICITGIRVLSEVSNFYIKVHVEICGVSSSEETRIQQTTGPGQL